MNFLLNPVETILKAKEEKDMVRSILILLVASVLLGLAAAIAILAVPLGDLDIPTGGFMAIGAGIMAVVVFILVFIAGLFSGLVLRLVFTILGGEGTYFEGLTVVAYSLLPLSIGMIVTSLAIHVPFVGGIIAFVFFAIFSAVAYATMYRAAKELFETDMITAFVGISVIAAVMILSLYVLILSTIASIGFSGLIPGFP